MILESWTYQLIVSKPINPVEQENKDFTSELEIVTFTLELTFIEPPLNLSQNLLIVARELCQRH